MRLQKKIIINKNLNELNSLRIAVKSRYFIECKSDKDLDLAFNFIKQNKLKFLILGEGTNVVFRKDFEGMVIKNLYKKEKKITNDNVKISSGYNWDKFVLYCLKNSLFGLENLSGIPGTVGAGPIQNIGAYGEEISNYVKHVEVFNFADGNTEILNNKNCDFSYRGSFFKKNNHLFIKNIFFKLDKKFIPKNSYEDLRNFKFTKALEIRKKILEIRNKKLENYKVNPNVGSFFKNPLMNKNEFKSLKVLEPKVKFYNQDALIKISAAWLIENSGLKGFNFYKARVSNRHSLVLINEDKAPDSILKLRTKIKNLVKKKYKIKLEEEPTII